MKKQTSINIFGAEQRLVFLGGASGGWGGREVPKDEKPTEGNVCYVPEDTKAEGTRTVEAHEEKLLQTAKRQGLERIDETLKDFQVAEKLKKEGEEARAKINSVTTWDNRQTINRTVDDFERLATIETDKISLTPAIARARAIRKIDVAVKAETDPSKAVLLAYDAGKVKALLGNAKTLEDVAKIMERFGMDAAAGVQKQEWTPNTLQKVTQDTTGIAPGGGQPAIEAAEAAATGAPGVKGKETKHELTDEERAEKTKSWVKKLKVDVAKFNEFFSVDLDKTQPAELKQKIKDKQIALNEIGLEPQLNPDGVFGEKTYNAMNIALAAAEDEKETKKDDAAKTDVPETSEQKSTRLEKIKQLKETAVKAELAALRIAEHAKAEAPEIKKNLDERKLQAVQVVDDLYQEAKVQSGIALKVYKEAKQLLKGKTDTEVTAGLIVETQKAAKSTLRYAKETKVIAAEISLLAFKNIASTNSQYAKIKELRDKYNS